MQTKNGLILLTCRDCIVTKDDIVLLYILYVSYSYCGNSPREVLVQMTVFILLIFIQL